MNVLCVFAQTTSYQFLFTRTSWANQWQEDTFTEAVRCPISMDSTSLGILWVGMFCVSVLLIVWQCNIKTKWHQLLVIFTVKSEYLQAHMYIFAEVINVCLFVYPGVWCLSRRIAPQGNGNIMRSVWDETRRANSPNSSTAITNTLSLLLRMSQVTKMESLKCGKL